MSLLIKIPLTGMRGWVLIQLPSMRMVCDKWLFLAPKLGGKSDLHSETGLEIPLLKVHILSCFLCLNC
jgi:hypothetical protein